MRLISKYWKALLAIVLAGAAAFLFFSVYQTEKRTYEYDKELLNTTIMALQQNIATNTPYKDVQDEINAEKEKLTASRLELYQHFPVNILEEDQIAYVLYLESVFGTEISFEFDQPIAVMQLGDGSMLKTLDIIVNYRSTYQGFQDMINYLAQDEKVVSIDKANIKYYPKQDLAVGYVKVRLYVLDTTTSMNEVIKTHEYVGPTILNVPESGKENIFDNKYHQPTKELPQQKPYPSADDLKPGGGSDLDAKAWVTTFDGKYHAHYGCAYNSQVYHNMEEPIQMTIAEITNAGIQPCELCFG